MISVFKLAFSASAFLLAFSSLFFDVYNLALASSAFDLAISASSFQTRRFTSGEGAAAAGFLADTLTERDMLVQELVPSVAEVGERSTMWIAGEPTSSGACRKPPQSTE